MFEFLTSVMLLYISNIRVYVMCLHNNVILLDIDECVIKDICLAQNCINTLGSFHCISLSTYGSDYASSISSQSTYNGFSKLSSTNLGFEGETNKIVSSTGVALMTTNILHNPMTTDEVSMISNIKSLSTMLRGDEVSEVTNVVSIQLTSQRNAGLYQ